MSGWPTKTANSRINLALLTSLAVLGSALALACGKISNEARSARAENPPSSAAPQAPRGTSREFGVLAASEIEELHAGVTLGQWKLAHPEDTITIFEQQDFDPCNPLWCARATKREHWAEGGESVRHAYFYPPRPTSFRELPSGIEGKTLLTRDSVLGSIWIEAPEPDPQLGETMADNAIKAISDRFGQADRVSKVWYCNASDWTTTAKWKRGKLRIASAFDKRSGGNSPPRLLAFGILPASEVHIELRENSEAGDLYREVHEREIDLLAQAVKMAGLTEQLGTRLIEAAQPPETKPVNVRLSKLVSAIVPWLTEAKTVPAPRRAAALLAADVCLSLSRSTYGLEDREHRSKRRKLEALGARFTDNHLDGTVYLLSWLRQAVQLDPEGPAGDLALVRWMSFGMRRAAACADGSEYFRRVIREGEKYLARADDGELKKEAEYMVADAYSDIVGLAANVAPPYENASRYEREAPGARVKALKHYRAALGRSAESPSVRSSWKNAWRLLAGLPPIQLRFYCIYD